jgi:hypothetical protein
LEPQPINAELKIAAARQARRYFMGGPHRKKD